MELIQEINQQKKTIVQWFPGHMNKTLRVLKKRLKDIDLVIEVLDCRIAGSSLNPLLGDLTKNKEKIKFLNKQDLADESKTKLWLDFYNSQKNTKALAISSVNPLKVKQLINLCLPYKPNLEKTLNVLICGVPNVGKSTLINSLLGKKRVKVADIAGVTRAEQRLILSDDFYLWDTPGILWPKIIIPENGINLAICGSVGIRAYDEELVALELLNYLKINYPENLTNRYKLKEKKEEIQNLNDEELLFLVAKSRGTFLAGGKIDFQKSANILITDFRNNSLGKITLETPEEFKSWQNLAKMTEEKHKIEKLKNTKLRRIKTKT